MSHSDVPSYELNRLKQRDERPPNAPLRVWHTLRFTFAVADTLQCFDTVGWATGRASGLKKTGCWFVDGDNFVRALHVF